MVITNEMLGLSSSHIVFDDLDTPLHKDVVAPYQSLVNAADSHGFGLRAASGFRSFERQALIWNAKLSGQRAVLDDEGLPLDLRPLTAKERVFVVLRWSALPGASRHHWGTDFDIYDKFALGQGDLQLTVAETQRDGPFYDMYCWLNDYLPQTAFRRPYIKDTGGIAVEPWHLSYAPVAAAFEQALDKAVLREVIEKSELLLKEVVLAHLDEIFERFVLVT